MVDVCDVPVVSKVCDVAGDAAASLVTAPFDWLAEGMTRAPEDVIAEVEGLIRRALCTPEARARGEARGMADEVAYAPRTSGASSVRRPSTRRTT